QLVLENSGRKIAYSRLRVTDAIGKELTARMEVHSIGDEERQMGLPLPKGEGRGEGEERARPSKNPAPTLVVLVNDADAVYPVRIDSTFSDANWTSMCGIPSADFYVYAAVLDCSGNLYIGGPFTVVREVVANHVAKRDVSSAS